MPLLRTRPPERSRCGYGLFIIDHGRRRSVHFIATYNPTAQWVIQQLREAFPFDTAPAHLIFDRDAIFSAAVVRFVQALRANPFGLHSAGRLRMLLGTGLLVLAMGRGRSVGVAPLR